MIVFQVLHRAGFIGVGSKGVGGPRKLLIPFCRLFQRLSVTRQRFVSGELVQRLVQESQGGFQLDAEHACDGPAFCRGRTGVRFSGDGVGVGRFASDLVGLGGVRGLL